MRKIACEWVFDGNSLLPWQTLVMDGTGRVVAIEDGALPDAVRLKGLVSPAFVNAHCHLELSHLRGKIPKNTGMAGFVKAVQALRDPPREEERAEAMEYALQEMRSSGIAAIGDICNGISSLAVKKHHPEFFFHNFIELFGLNPSMAEEIFLRGLGLLKDFGRHSSLTPHAPYSMSVSLRDKLFGYAKRREWPISIHLLESKEERQLFEALEGPMMDFIRDIGAVFQAHHYRDAIQFVTESLPANCNALLVHCTEIRPEEAAAIATGWPRTFFVLCPLANRYIHGTMPDGNLLRAHPGRVCLGTDSLAGNEGLSILAEMHCLQQAQDLPSDLLLRSATVNGATALALDLDRFRIAVGSSPILVHLPEFSGEKPMIPSHSNLQFLDTCS
jgi:cytosine/adenosine deaminase-related metal-dependent hydrolase